MVACCTVRSGVFHHWIHHLWPQGAFPPGFNPLRRGWVYRPAPEAPRKGECRRGPRHFWNCLSRLGYGPATGPTLKTALCHIRTLVGRRINTALLANAPGPILDFGPERGPGKGTMADLGPLIRHLVSTRLPPGGRAAFLSPLSPLYGTRPCV